MLDSLRQFLFGAPIHSGLEGLPQDARDAHHRLRNTSMKMEQAKREIKAEASDLLELLASDIRRTGVG